VWSGRYLADRVVEEQVLRNVNSILKNVHHKVSRENKELEISFAQENPPAVVLLRETSGDELQQIKADLQNQFGECKERAATIWKQARIRIETEKRKILQQINNQLTRYLNALTVTIVYLRNVTLPIR